MRGADTKTTAGNAAMFALSARPPGGTAVTSEEFRVQSDNLTLPTITFWTAVPSLTGDAHSLRMSWAPLAVNGVSSASSYKTMFDHSGRLFWSSDTSETSSAFDTRVLEDASGAAWVEAKAHSTGLGMAVDFTFDSPAITYKGSAGAPPYRADNVAKPVPCASPLPSKSKNAPGCTMTFDLGASRSLALLVLRDCNGRCTLQASNDQVAWADLGAVSARFAMVQPPALKARYVRIAIPAPNQLGTLSVW
jgi:hypothetical protein